MAYAYQNVSNPAAFGVEYRAGDTGNTYQIVNSRGTTSLMFGVKHADKTEWMTSRIENPERFGLTEPPKTYKAFLAIARAFVEA